MAYRFLGVLMLNFIDPALLLAFYGFCCSLFCLLVSQLPGYSAVACLFCLFFFESICYPVRLFLFLNYTSFIVYFQCIFTLGTKNLGVHTKRGSGLIVMVSPLVFWLCSIQGSH